MTIHTSPKIPGKKIEKSFGIVDSWGFYGEGDISDFVDKLKADLAKKAEALGASDVISAGISIAGPAQDEGKTFYRAIVVYGTAVLAKEQ